MFNQPINPTHKIAAGKNSLYYNFHKHMKFIKFFFTARHKAKSHCDGEREREGGGSVECWNIEVVWLDISLGI